MKYFLSFIFAFLISSNVFAQEKTLDRPPVISSSINPIYQIAKFISADEKNNSLIIDPKYFEYRYRVKRKDIKTISESDIFFYVDNNLEKNIAEKFDEIQGSTKMIRLAKDKNLNVATYEIRGQATMSDNNIWLDPNNAIEIAKIITQNLSELYPKFADKYNKNLQVFIEDVKKMDEENKEILLPIKKAKYICAKNRLAYFENNYQILGTASLIYSYDYDSIAVDYKMSAGDIEKMQNLARSGDVDCALWNVQENNSLIKGIALANRIKLVKIDVLGKNNITKGENGYVILMKDLAHQIASCQK